MLLLQEHLKWIKFRFKSQSLQNADFGITEEKLNDKNVHTIEQSVLVNEGLLIRVTFDYSVIDQHAINYEWNNKNLCEEYRTVFLFCSEIITVMKLSRLNP